MTETETMETTAPEVEEPEPQAAIPQELRDQQTKIFLDYEKASAAFDAADAKRKAAKAYLDAATEAMVEITRQMVKGPGPLYSNAQPEVPDPAKEDGELALATDLGDLGDLPLSESLLEKLATGGPFPIQMIGDLAKAQEQYGEDWWREWRGVGKESAAKIEQAVEAFWVQWRQDHPEPVPQEPQGPEPDPEEPEADGAET